MQKVVAQQKKGAGSDAHPKRGRPRKTEAKEHEEEEHDEEEEENKKTKQQKQDNDADEEMNGNDNGYNSKEFEDFVQQLHDNVSIEEVKVVLEENGLDTTLGSDDKLYHSCADLLFFGTCETCPSCKGVLEFAGQRYHCSDYSTEWTKCNYSTPDGRKGDKPKLPSKANDFLKKWVKSHAIVSRPLEPSDKFFSGMTFVLAGRLSRPQGEVKQDIERYGGRVVHNPGQGVTALLVSDQEPSRGGSSKMEDATELNLPICREQWVSDSIRRGKALPLDSYSLASEISGIEESDVPWDKRPPQEEAALSLMAEVKLVGKRGVYKDSELEEEGGKIYEKNDIIYNCAFSACDIYIDMNQYAILQLIEVPVKKQKKNPDIYIYVKEGRVGDRRSVRERLDLQESTRAAVKEFERVFEQLTGNPFEPWEREKKFSKKRNKYFPIDMSPGVDVRAGGLEVRQMGVAALHCQLDPRVVEFLKLFFSQLTYRYAMTEMGVDAPDLPTGNLTDWHIEFCMQVLNEFLEYLKNQSKNDNDQKREQMCLDFSNKWFSLLHSTRPFVIKNLRQLAELAAPVLESVRDISHASRIIGDMTGDTLDDPMSDRFAKMEIQMTPLNKEGEDYKMIFKYLSTNMEPLKLPDGEYGVIVEDVVQIESQAAPSFKDMEKVPNRMLLWCGMRASNLVASLSRGFQPASIDAPAPYYTFGRGIYCTDAACKAAYYGFTAADRPEGFLVLAIVGVGEELLELPAPKKPVKEYEEAGTPVKILGKKMPNPEEHFTWKDVIVPCGSLKESNVKGVLDYMEYNEYCVYNPKQVKPVFLVKFRYEGITVIEE